MGAVDANAELKKFLFKATSPLTTDVQNETAEIKIKDGEVVRPIQLSHVGSAWDWGVYVNHGENILTTLHFNRDQYNPIIGPAVIKFNIALKGTQKMGILFIYDHLKTINTISNSSPSLPSNTVVIPTDASGPVEIVMESSKDLVNWTRAEPGTYGTDTPKRFFRIRAVVKPGGNQGGGGRP